MCFESWRLVGTNVRLEIGTVQCGNTCTRIQKTGMYYESGYVFREAALHPALFGISCKLYIVVVRINF
jgi:hypothetical protein